MQHDDFEAEAYDPTDPKHPDWAEAVTDRADTARDNIKPSPVTDPWQPSPLGNILFDLASSEGMLVAARLAGLQYAMEEVVDEDDEGSQ
jgi:hypothetical protein